MNDTSPLNVINFPRRLRVLDCQGEANNPPFDLQSMIAKQIKERQQRAHKEAWDEFAAACRHLFKVATDDPFEHAMKFIQDMKGRKS